MQNKKWVRFSSKFLLGFLFCSFLLLDSGPSANAKTQVYPLSVTAGYNHTCALLTDQTVICWGSNESGQLGNGNTIDSSVPVKVAGLSKVKVIQAGARHTCALKMDGQVLCWGNNESGQIGADPALKINSSLPISVLSGAANLIVGFNNTCVLQSSKRLKCWGQNFGNNIFGNEVGEYTFTPVEIQNLSNVKSASIGAVHACALLTSGKAMCWGDNSRGQLGTDSVEQTSSPVEVGGLLDLNSIVAGGLHTCAVDKLGYVFCWGWNEYNQVSEYGNSVVKLSSMVTGVNRTSVVKSAIYFNCALYAESNAQTPGISKVRCWGKDYLYKRLNTNIGNWEPPREPTGLISLAVGATHACGVLEDYKLLCWGRNDLGQLGNGLKLAGMYEPVSVKGISWLPTAISITKVGNSANISIKGNIGIHCWVRINNGKTLPVKSIKLSKTNQIFKFPVAKGYSVEVFTATEPWNPRWKTF